MSDDLAARVLAAIEETERIAQAATPGPWQRFLGHDIGVGQPVVPDSPVDGHTVAEMPRCADHVDRRCEDAAHIAHNDPESVLRRCAADREIVVLHTPKTAEIYTEHPGNGDYDFGCPSCHYEWDCEEIMRMGYCATLIALAKGYGIDVDGG